MAEVVAEQLNAFNCEVDDHGIGSPLVIHPKASKVVQFAHGVGLEKTAEPLQLLTCSIAPDQSHLSSDDQP